MDTLNARFIDLPSRTDTLNKLSAYLSSRKCAWQHTPTNILRIHAAKGSGKSVLLAALAYRLAQSAPIHLIYVPLLRGRAPLHMLRSVLSALCRIQGAPPDSNYEGYTHTELLMALGRAMEKRTSGDIGMIIDGANAGEEHALTSLFRHISDKIAPNHTFPGYYIRCVYASESAGGTGFSVPPLAPSEAATVVQNTLAHLASVPHTAVANIAHILVDKCRNLSYLHAAAHYASLSHSTRGAEDGGRDLSHADSFKESVQELPSQLDKLYENYVSAYARISYQCFVL
jgi:hypothetical protein